MTSTSSLGQFPGKETECLDERISVKAIDPAMKGSGRSAANDSESCRYEAWVDLEKASNLSARTAGSTD